MWARLPDIEGLPIIKGPYGRITALDLNKGTEVWMVANGDGPRYHPLLKALNLPPLGVPNRPAPVLTKTLLFLGRGQQCRQRYAADRLGMGQESSAPTTRRPAG